ncbi:glycine--tRNA ligase [Candidatus Pacearchaeota archaeon CG10_big_fil_rev_8_21_14_0_10_34_12]|nr:MAG: glycine--tRNA ligase [Candidatus Pacearchaeota archaeon CG10_big_fil_rev_8_21_14_0_10_34_12]
MAFIVKKKIKGNEYYYLNENKRVEGKVRTKTLAYLGKNKKDAEKKADEIIKNLEIGKQKRNSLVERERDKNEKTEGKVMKEENLSASKTPTTESNNGSKESKEFTSFVQEGGFIWGPEPEIYRGLAGFYTYGPIGKLLKNKVENSVRKVFNSNGFRELEGPTVMPDVVWKASGHLDTFSDPVISTKDGKENYRVDKLLEEKGIQITSMDKEYLLELIKKNKIKAPNGKELGDKIESYSLMMKTNVAGQESSLRPETATVTYLPFLRLWNYFRKKTPFAVYQIGKAYRNEISPRQSVIRGREFTQAEGQIFVDPLKKNDWPAFEEIKSEKLPLWNSNDQKGGNGLTRISVERAFEIGLVKSKAYAWCLWLAYNQFLNFGISEKRIRLRQHHPDEKAFYADDAWDIEVNLNNYGWTELCGIHDRTDYDLKQHSKASGINLEAVRENGERFFPHILEIAFGTDRPTYALIDLFYEKKLEEEGKTVFKVPYFMAPIDVSIFPLMKKPELTRAAREIKKILGESFIVDYDESGSIGRRYLRSALAGTPFAITVDYETLEKQDVTVRNRDTEKQVRIKISELKNFLRKLINCEEKI